MGDQQFLKNYEITENGSIYRKEIKVKGGNNVRTLKRKKIKTHKNNKGYYLLNAHNKGIYKSFLVHRLVYLKYIGSIPKGFCVHHINGDKNDNRYSNLATMPHKLHSSLENRTIEKDLAKYIKWLYRTGDITQSKIAKLFVLSESTIGDIVNNKRVYMN